MNEIEEEYKDIFKKELEVSEKLEELKKDNTDDELASAILNVANVALDNAQDPMRELKIHHLTAQFARDIGNDELMEIAKERANKWSEEHG